jgi:hypothetical protein
MKSVKFAGKRLAPGGEMVEDRALDRRLAAQEQETDRNMGAAKKKCIRCEDCYFKQNMLCALKLDAPCATFRPAERGLAPERQLAFVFRSDRIRAAYAFPQPQGRW